MVDEYKAAREMGLSHEEALTQSGMPRTVAFAAARVEGMSPKEAAAAVGYTGKQAPYAARSLAQRAVKMHEASQGAGAAAWLCPAHYRAKRKALAAQCVELEVMEKACVAMVIACHSAPAANNGNEPAQCAQAEPVCGCGEGEQG